MLEVSPSPSCSWALVTGEGADPQAEECWWSPCRAQDVPVVKAASIEIHHNYTCCPAQLLDDSHLQCDTILFEQTSYIQIIIIF